jgi:hypothetical protein
MMQHYKELDVPFSTADVEVEKVTFEGRQLLVALKDDRGELTEVLFDGVCGFKWDDLSFTRIDAAPDRVYEVVNSEWLSQWPVDAALSHYSLGICGSHGYVFLDVIAKAMAYEMPNQRVESNADSAPRNPGGSLSS